MRTWVSLLRVFFFLLFLKKTTSVALFIREVEDFTVADRGTTVPKKSYHHLELSPIRLNELWTHTDNRATRVKVTGCQRGSWGSVQRRRGGDQYSEMVDVEGEDPATPGYLRSVDTRKPQDHNNSPISG